MNRLVTILATCLGLGYLPGMPGTYGSVLGVVLVYVLRDLPIAYYALFIAVFSLSAVWISSRAEELFKEHDSSKIVIDEIVGILVTFIWIPFTWPTALAGFLLFRFFDIAKMTPIKQAQNLPRGWGVVADDFLAGVFANIVLQIALSGWYMYAG